MFIKNKSGENYKLESLKVYAWDRNVGGKKKFRKVFDRSELNYVSADFKCYNKLFDEKDWEGEIKMVANKISGEKREQICEKVEKITISKGDNTFRYSYGWGADERGSFWKKGIYEWCAYIDGESVACTKFYVEDVGKVTDDQNPFFSAITLRTYESSNGRLDSEELPHLKIFNQKTTRYIVGELRFTNHIPREWYCELFFNFYDDTGMHIGTSSSFSIITPNEGVGEIFSTTGGCGHEEPGVIWIPDNYTLEVVFMDNVVGIIPFSVGEKEVERVSDYEALLNGEVDLLYSDSLNIKDALSGNRDSNQDHSNVEKNKTEQKNDPSVEVYIDDRPLEEILSELNSLIGLENIKNKIREYIDYVSFLQLRENSGIKESEEIVLHSVFTGNPGTGKTTVVKLLGKIFKSMGLLSKGHVHTVEANDLIAGYIRQTGKDTKKAIEQARGGILFIDEAYMLYKDGSPGDFGPEAIAALITEMSDGEGDIAIMAAGYPAEMESFLKSNPGLKSRIRNYFHFEDYVPDELYDIAEFAAKKKGVKISDGAGLKLREILKEAFRKRDRSFGNARFSFSLIDEAKINLGKRLMRNADIEKLSKEELSILMAEDIEDVGIPDVEKKLNLGIDEDLLKAALDELNGLTGLNNIKQEVNELIKLTRYYRENNREILNAFSMHSVFKGNPGTGKTTVARIMASVYKALGMLERGHLIDADGSDLEAGYLGQTSLKTKELIEKAMGGILFIDEAYSITEGRNSDFGKKAIAALIKEMEDHRSEFGIIVAGYTKNMEHFLESNPGLKSRFDQNFYFEDFTENELWEIMENMLKSRGLKPDPQAEKYLKNHITLLYENRDRFFGNARSMRKIVEKTVRKQELRMADIPKMKRTKEMIKTIILKDVEAILPEKKIKEARKKLGFKIG